MSAFARIFQQAFEVDPPLARAWPKKLGLKNLRLARRKGKVVGGLGLIPMGQWFGGRRVPMTGIAAVCTTPEQRASGIGSELMRSVVKEMHRRRVPLSVLFPATRAVYSRVGYECAGAWVTYTMPTASIPSRDRSLPMRRADLKSIRPLYAEYARRQNGLLDRSEYIWNRVTSDAYAYVLGKNEGYVVYRQQTPAGSYHYDLLIRDIVALTPRVWPRLLTFFADHRSVCDNVKWVGGPADPLRLFNEPIEKPSRMVVWMLRINDVKLALEARGYAVDGEAHLEVADDLIPQNNGRFVLTTKNGRGVVRRGGPGATKVDIRGLAALYSGFLSSAQAAAVGLAGGDEIPLFAGPVPWMPDLF